ncbi:hypothetical protein NQ176_g556 [Zarea fungicola]|uniref:Uncharacterized protein n=1 Tax=Zarea fungicola TaxID=93591 RepID=A0ACC1NWV4_9HYPO|nr:hypothetical protein NQ176_g556 [Lecanicillium fungicola]
MTFLTLGNGHRVEAYGPVMGIATAIIAIGIFFTLMVGPERRGRAFDNTVASAKTVAGLDKQGDDHGEEKAYADTDSVADVERHGGKRMNEVGPCA